MIERLRSAYKSDARDYIEVEGVKRGGGRGRGKGEGEGYQDGGTEREATMMT